MAKYVCDFQTVNTIAKNLENQANELINSMGSYTSTLSSDLTKYTGDAKNNFIASNQTKAQTIKSNAVQISELSKFIKDASDRIQEAESQLASLSI